MKQSQQQAILAARVALQTATADVINWNYPPHPQDEQDFQPVVDEKIIKLNQQVGNHD